MARALQVVLGAVLMAAAVSPAAAQKKRPNLVIILTDDQDMKLGSLEVMPKLHKLVAAEGVFFTNGFIATPICCPSRSTYISGLYQHNHRCLQNGVHQGCSSPTWRSGPERLSAAAALKQVGYTTMYAGKYLNAYGTNNASGGVEHVPVGWDNWLGLVGNSRYYDYAISRNGVREAHGSDYGSDYFTDLIRNETVKFLKAHLGKGKPVFTWAATPACHGPNDAAPQYQSLFGNVRAPRTPNFNTGTTGKNTFNSAEFHPTMNESEINFSDNVHQRRLQTLQSVDDLVEAVVATLQAAGELEDTVILYTSDHVCANHNPPPPFPFPAPPDPDTNCGGAC
jgi:N-acetylglucosamine-6-sulfatase